MIIRLTLLGIMTAAACLIIWSVAQTMNAQIERTMELHRNFTAPNTERLFYDI